MYKRASSRKLSKISFEDDGYMYRTEFYYVIYDFEGEPLKTVRSKWEAKQHCDKYHSDFYKKVVRKIKVDTWEKAPY